MCVRACVSCELVASLFFVMRVVCGMWVWGFCFVAGLITIPGPYVFRVALFTCFFLSMAYPTHPFIHAPHSIRVSYAIPSHPQPGDGRGSGSGAGAGAVSGGGGGSSGTDAELFSTSLGQDFLNLFAQSGKR